MTVGGLRDDEAADGHGPSTRRSGGGGDDGVADESEQRFIGGGPVRGGGECSEISISAATAISAGKR